MNRGLQSLELKHSAAARILDAALNAADPAIAVTGGLQSLQLSGAIADSQRLGLIAMGKACIPMAQAACKFLDDQVKGGIVVGKMLTEDAVDRFQGLTVLSGSHPVPDENSLNAGNSIIKFLETNGDLDAFLFLISGGASALVTRPAAGINLDDVKRTTSLLLGCGASIDEVNTVRKHLDDIKGGGLAVLAAPVPCVTLVLSDVPGDRLDMIASGPTVPDPTTFSDAVTVLEKYSLMDAVPEPVKTHFLAGRKEEITETPKPGDIRFEKNHVMIVGSLDLSISAAEREAQQAGYQTIRLQPQLCGEAADQGRMLGRLLADRAKSAKPGERLCWIGGGETTVNLGKGSTGRGGRNQELAMAAVEELTGFNNAALVTFATDGDDGLSPAAGAIVTGQTALQAAQKGLDTAGYLARHDSYSYFEALNSAIITGPTGTNVNDLVLLLVN